MASIRVANVTDAAAIAHVHVASWLTTYEEILPKEYLSSLRESDRVPLWQDWLTRDICAFVAEVGGEIVGFSAGGGIRDPIHDYDSELYTLYLLKEVQGQGVGKALLEAVAKALDQKDFRSMLVWVLEQSPAVRFYEKVGAQLVMRKEIEIGGIRLYESALGWPHLRAGGGTW